MLCSISREPIVPRNGRGHARGNLGGVGLEPASRYAFDFKHTARIGTLHGFLKLFFFRGGKRRRHRICDVYLRREGRKVEARLSSFHSVGR